MRFFPFIGLILLTCFSQPEVGFGQVEVAKPLSGINAKTIATTGTSDTRSFDNDWLFSRFGLQPDGTTMQEPQGLEQVGANDAS